MKTIDYHNQETVLKLLTMQEKHCWNLETKFNWNTNIDLEQFLLPIEEFQLTYPDLNEHELKVFSQFIGLAIISTIAQMEKVAIELQESAWSNLFKYRSELAFKSLGKQFFSEELKHSQMFHRYLDKFAKSINLSSEELASFLPTTKFSITKYIYKINALFGGMAMWWLIFSLEEESVKIFRKLAPFKNKIEPLYYSMHEAHFEEEMRHKSYAIMMLKKFQKDSNKWNRKFFQKIDFATAETLNILWTIKQLHRFKNIKKFKDRHQFLNTLDNVFNKLGKNSIKNKYTLLLCHTPYISEALNLSSHKNIATLKKDFKCLNSPFVWKKVYE